MLNLKHTQAHTHPFFPLKYCLQTQGNEFGNIADFIWIVPLTVRGQCKVRTKWQGPWKGPRAFYLQELCKHTGRLPQGKKPSHLRKLQTTVCLSCLGSCSLVCLKSVWCSSGGWGRVSKAQPMGHLYLCLRSLCTKNRFLFFVFF